ncbi:MAG: uracil phosphoribosyltransferase [Defluviitaleaceae bacterium]|nr:uracil phosphoribosyltransferase [Defluviitaleaceae bacterium]
MKNLEIVKHPLIDHKISMIRKKETGNKEFRELVHELASIICYEATRETPTQAQAIQTPVEDSTGYFIAQKFAVVPILRAGVGMVDGIVKFFPAAKIGHIGLYRDPSTLNPVKYYVKLPSDINEREVFLVDPMVATGGSAIEAINILKENGAQKIKVLCLVSCPEGVEKIGKLHPDVKIYTAAHDEKGLNSKGYIVPGLGDAGDRIFGTQ